MNLERFKESLYEINLIGKQTRGVTRLAYSDEDKRAKDYFISLCKEAGLDVSMDECGNIFARRKGENPGLPPVAVGSHLDTVTEGGEFDGTIGVLGALEMVRSLDDKKIKTQHPIEIICFATEESSRFGVSTIGSKLLAGKINQSSLEKLVDHNGISIKEALSSVGLNFNNVHRCAVDRDKYKAFLEMHIEQGPFLESTDTSIGIVTGIAAPSRFRVSINGKASHSGATSMNLRKDALLGGAEIILAVESFVKQESEFQTVGTVGHLEVLPGAMNVVPGHVNLLIDIRSISVGSKERVIYKLMKEIKTIENNRNLTIEYEMLSDEEPVILNEHLMQEFEKSCQKLKISYQHMPSGAGHDAMNLVDLCPTGLIFVPSKDGLSHHPDEYTSFEEIEKGIHVLEETVITLAGVRKERSRFLYKENA